MLVEHTLTVTAKCPVNSGMDVYDVTVRLGKIVKVETIVEFAHDYVNSEIFQEDLTADFAKYFECECESVGMHGNVKTRVVYDARPSQRVHKNGKATGGSKAKESRRTVDASKRK